MFIRKKAKKDKSSNKTYYSYQLVESVRTERGPRQRILLYLNSELDLTKEERHHLASCIEDSIKGTKRLFPYPEKIEKLAQIFAKQLVGKQAERLPENTQEEKKTDYHTVDCNTIQHEYARGVGIEYIALKMFQKLGLKEKLSEIGLTKRQVDIATGVIIGKLAQPSSERATHTWLQKQSAIDELMDCDFSRLSLNSVYQVADLLLKEKDTLEEHLQVTEKSLFSLEETVILYDLTNTYLEGTAKGIEKAKRGRSKEKRSDCPLVTLGLIIDENGFIKKSTILPGNVSEPKTLQEAIEKVGYDDKKKPVIVLDAGFATEENLQWLREKERPYIVCSRKRIGKIPQDLSLEIVQEKKGNIVKAAQVIDENTEEAIVYCHSVMKEKKEESMKDSSQKHFEEALKKLREGLTKKRCMKAYDKVVEKVGRLKEKYRSISSHYKIIVVADESSKQAVDISWNLNSETCEKRFSGIYQLRTYKLQWDSKKLWNTYVMLTEVEESFRCLKSELGLRPVYHKKSSRVDGHLFITVLAYHLMKGILHELAMKGIYLNWNTLRRGMSTQVRVTTSMQTEDGKKIYIRASTQPESFHKKIYKALELPSTPGNKVKTIM